MRLDEAIKLLQQDLDDPGSVDIVYVLKAQELSIEALKWFEAERQRRGATKTMWLTGETE